LRNVSLKRLISTSRWLRKFSISNFLPRTPSASQQARRRALHRSVLLGRAAIFGYEKRDGLQESLRASCPCGEGTEREEPTGELHTCLERKVIEEISVFLDWEVELQVGTSRLCIVGVAAAVLTLAAAFFLDFPAARLGCIHYCVTS